jgi:hypothetical protein
MEALPSGCFVQPQFLDLDAELAGKRSLVPSGWRLLSRFPGAEGSLLYPNALRQGGDGEEPSLARPYRRCCREAVEPSGGVFPQLSQSGRPRHDAQDNRRFRVDKAGCWRILMVNRRFQLRTTGDPQLQGVIGSMQWTTSATPRGGVESGAIRLPALLVDLDITPAEDLVPGWQPVVLPFPGGAFVDRTCTHWVQVSSPGHRFEVLELPGRCTVVDLVAELVAAPRVTWSRADAELVVAVLAERPGYAAQIPWWSAR